MKRTILITLTLLLGLAQGAWAEAYTYYIVERDPNTNTLYFKGTNIEPENNNNSHRYSIDYKYNGAPIWSLGEGTVWPTVTKIVFEPSFAEARPTDISMWFAYKPNLTSIVGMNEYLNTSEVTSMSLLFWGCSSLTMLDLSSFNTAKVTEMHYMFKDCSNLKTIVVGDGWTTSNVSINWNHGLFEGCTSLVGQDGTTLSSTVDISKAHYGDGGYLTSEVYYWSNSNNIIPSAFYDVSNSGTTITIHNMGDMKLLAQNVNNGNNYSGYTFLLARDLALDPSVENNFTTIGNSNTHYFAGTFDGQGHTISGININATIRQGLFGSVSGGTIKNLTLSNSTITCTNTASAGGIVGVSDNGVTIENCHVTKDVTIISGNNSGGIIGSTNKGDVNITGCTSAAKVTSQSGVGGIIGKCGNESSRDTTAVTITDCLYYGESLTGSGNNAIVGGIVGFYCTHKTNNNELISQVTLGNNYYSTGLAASIKGIGQKKNITGDTSNTTSNCDLIDNNGAIRVHVVTTAADIVDMGTAGTPYANGITPYTYGIAYDEKYYSHVLALDNNRDCTSLLEEYNGMTFNVKLRGRTLYKDGCWNTICLPFAYSGGIFTGDCELRELNTTGLYYVGSDSESGTHYKTGVQDGKLYLFFKTTNPRDKIEAGTPYIVKWTRVNDYNEYDSSHDYFEPIFNNVTIDATGPNSVTSGDEAVTFTPTYKPVSFESQELSVLYIGTNNSLYYPQGNGTTNIYTFRAYFQLNNGFHMASGSSGDGADDEQFSGGGDARVLIIDIESDTEGIGTLTTDLSPLTSDWYTLDGRKLIGKPSAPGVYVNNKHKVIIK